jgi:hypothetical protein
MTTPTPNPLQEVQYETISYEVDPLTCQQCGSQMKIRAFITEPSVVRRILDHLDSKPRQRAPPDSSTRLH